MKLIDTATPPLHDGGPTHPIRERPLQHIQCEATVEQDVEIPLIDAEKLHPARHIRVAAQVRSAAEHRSPESVGPKQHPIGHHVHRDVHPRRPARLHVAAWGVRHADRHPPVEELRGAVPEAEGGHVGVLYGDVGGEGSVHGDRVGRRAYTGDEEAVEAETVHGEARILNLEDGEGKNEDDDAEEDDGGPAATAAAKEAAALAEVFVGGAAPKAALVVVGGGVDSGGEGGGSGL
ncbi:hypothetical protein HPP92_005175 [Vanilla planifolia]|uniref:Uncharacterized protein n=1 Tax=Vanilla planifolia TaxID=51239 RepID=A0A835RL74_VANPL|nr:hypothetical protein HPP92_005175 [Vanilla planifolia]